MQVGNGACRFLVWCLAWRVCRLGLVSAPCRVSDRLRPQLQRELGLDEKTSGVQVQRLVEPLGLAILLRGVVHSEPMLCANVIEVIGEFL
jgi:hypothetical protein